MGHWVGVKTFCYVTLERKLTWTFRKHRLGKHISKRTQTEIRKGNTYGSEFTTSFPLAPLPTSNREKVLVFQLVGKVTSRRVKYQMYKSEINIIANKSLFQIVRFPCKMICAPNLIRYCGNELVSFCWFSIFIPFDFSSQMKIEKFHPTGIYVPCVCQQTVLISRSFICIFVKQRSLFPARQWISQRIRTQFYASIVILCF